MSRTYSTQLSSSKSSMSPHRTPIFAHPIAWVVFFKFEYSHTHTHTHTFTFLTILLQTLLPGWRFFKFEYSHTHTHTHTFIFLTALFVQTSMSPHRNPIFAHPIACVVLVFLNKAIHTHTHTFTFLTALFV